MNVEKRKLLTSLTALVCVAALLVGGTFAWRGVASALNEFGDEEITPPDPMDPGANLHDDFDAETGDKTCFALSFREVTDYILGDAKLYNAALPSPEKIKAPFGDKFTEPLNPTTIHTWMRSKDRSTTNSYIFANDGRTFVMSAVRNIVGARPALWISNK